MTVFEQFTQIWSLFSPGKRKREDEPAITNKENGRTTRPRHSEGARIGGAPPPGDHSSQPESPALGLTREVEEARGAPEVLASQPPLLLASTPLPEPPAVSGYSGRASLRTPTGGTSEGYTLHDRFLSQLQAGSPRLGRQGPLRRPGLEYDAGPSLLAQRGGPSLLAASSPAGQVGSAVVALAPYQISPLNPAMFRGRQYWYWRRRCLRLLACR
jgi:hypothetical protein